MKGEVDMNKLSSEELSKVAGGKEIEEFEGGWVAKDDLYK